MTSLTLELPDAVAEEMRPLEPWLPTLLQLSALGFQTRAAASVKEAMDFLAKDPSPQEVVNFQISESEQERLELLANMQDQRTLSHEEQMEVEEYLRFNHIGAMLKIKALQMIQQDN